MRVWQTTWDSHKRLVLWAESGSAYEASLESEVSDTNHPFAADIEKLTSDLDELQFDPDSTTTLDLVLPTIDGRPLPSTHLVRVLEKDSVASQVSLAKWQVPALVLEPTPAISFLSSIPKELPFGIFLDDSVYYWVESTKLLLELLSRGRFLPGINYEGTEAVGFWNLIPDDEYDRERLRKLTSAMPAICRAATINSSDEAPTSNTVLESFLSTCADSLIRTFLSRQETLNIAAQKLEGPQQEGFKKWIDSLEGQDNKIEIGRYELTKLETKLQRWSQKTSSIVPHILQTGIQIDSPEVEDPSEDGLWTIRVFLQSKNRGEDKLFAEEIWSGNLGFLKQSEYTISDLEEKILKDIGKASKLFPPMKEMLTEAYPTEIKLSTNDAYSFLRDTVVLLEQSDFDVVLPKWWSDSSAKLGLHLKVNPGDKSNSAANVDPVLGINRLVNFSWNISLGDKELTLEEFEELVQKNTPLINVKGQWLELNQKDIQATKDFLSKQKDGSKIELIDALKLGLGIDQESVDLPILGFEATGWVQRLLQAEEKGIEVEEKPEGLKGELRHYQQKGIAWLNFLDSIGCGGCLADDMGLGKTIQLLGLLTYEREKAKKNDQPKPQPTLLVVPMSILENWLRETKKFAPDLNVYVHHGALRLTEELFTKACEEHDVVLTTYSLAHRDLAMMLNIHWGRIALDEAQNIKNLNTKQTKAIRQLVYEQLAKHGNSCKRVALTGTPLENHLEELWSIFDFLNPGYLGNLKNFRTKFVLPIERFRSAESADALSQIVKPFLLRRVKTDKTVIDDLPEKMEMDVFTNLTEEQSSLYKAVLNDMMTQVEKADGIKRKGLVLAAITKLKQICNHPTLFLKDGSALDDRSGKLTRLKELLEVILAEKDRTLIFTQYAQMGALLKNYLQNQFNQDVLFLHGNVAQKSRQKMVDAFQDEAGPNIFVLSLKVGGLGLNLTAANQIIHYDQWWNPAIQDQATDRAFRIGQKKNVQVRTFICKGTLEEQISEMLKQKKDLADTVVNSAKSEITNLSVDELREILKLRVEGSA